MDISSILASSDFDDTLSLSLDVPQSQTVCPDNPEGDSIMSWEPFPISPMVEVFSSTLDSLDLERFKWLYDIPEDIVLRVLEVSKRACHIQPEEICLYEQALVADLRFSIAQFIRDLLLCVGFSPAQLMPNFWKIVIGCIILCTAYTGRHYLISFSEFLFCYQLIKKEAGWWFFTACDSFRNLIIGLPTSHKGWKSRFF